MQSTIKPVAWRTLCSNGQYAIWQQKPTAETFVSNPELLEPLYSGKHYSQVLEEARNYLSDIRMYLCETHNCTWKDPYVTWASDIIKMIDELEKPL